MMEDVDGDDATRDKPVTGELIIETNTATNEEDSELVYNHTHFRRDKTRCRYFRYYHVPKIIIKRGAAIKEFNERASRVRAVLDAQGWTDMAKDHHPTVETIVWEFYANLHQRCGDSFRTWLRGRAIKVTPTLISKITGAPHVRDPAYPYLVDHLPAHADLVACFVEGCPHQMELEGEGSF
jgi:hypothetical protein